MVKAVGAPRFQRFPKNRRLFVMLLDQFDHDLTDKGDREADLHLGCRAAINPFRRHERADQKPRTDVKKLRIAAHFLFDIGDRVGDLDDLIVARAETEPVHQISSGKLLNARMTAPRGADQLSSIATQRVQPAEAASIFTGKQHTLKPNGGS